MRKTLAFVSLSFLTLILFACNSDTPLAATEAIAPSATQPPATATLATTPTTPPTATEAIPPSNTPRPAATETATPLPPFVAIDGAITYQTVDGFGASGAFRSASEMHGSTGLSADQQKAILDLLFSTETGAGLSIWRNEIGSSTTASTGGADDGDNVASIEPTDPGGPDAAPAYIWDGSDGDQLWLSLQAQAYGVTQFYATAWGAPAYMKTNNSLKGGGFLCGVPGQECPSGDWRQHFADYLVQYLRYYKEAGIEIAYIGYQNEPDFAPQYTGMLWDVTPVTSERGQLDRATPQNIDFISNYLGPTLEKSGLTTRIACCDATDWVRTNLYADGILADPTTRGYVGMIAGHGYYTRLHGLLGSFVVTSAMDAGIPVWQTETADFGSWNAAWDEGNRGSTGLFWAEALWEALTTTQVNAYFYWWGAKAYESDAASANSPLIKIVADTFEPSKRLWAFAAYSRYVRPGATRIEANTNNEKLKTSAFVNEDGGTVIVVLNLAMTDQAVTFSLQNVTPASAVTPYLTNETSDMAAQPAVPLADGVFAANIPARSAVTYVIAGPGK
jgi:O-glycosyl hydrolase